MRSTAALLAACLVTLGAAPPVQAGALSAQEAWIRAVPGSDVAAAYLTLHNSGTQPVVVVGVRSPAAGMAMIHETALVNGKSTMRPHERLRIGAGETVRLAPGGLHIMLQNLNRTLAPEDEVPLVLLLEGGSVEVIAHVRPLGEE
jgi:copper(I)-binding protein